MSKRKWKELHSQLRRVSFVTFDEAEKSQSQDGGRERILQGKITFPERKGKKNKKKRENARVRHLEMLNEQIQEIVDRFSKTSND